jgi:hypothetical protein
VHATLHTILCQITEEALTCDVKGIICSKEDIDKQNSSGYSALHIASEHGHARAVELLIKHNANVRAIHVNPNLHAFIVLLL